MSVRPPVSARGRFMACPGSTWVG